MSALIVALPPAIEISRAVCVVAPAANVTGVRAAATFGLVLTSEIERPPAGAGSAS
jgi:hypothetical protein